MDDHMEVSQDVSTEVIDIEGVINKNDDLEKGVSEDSEMLVMMSTTLKKSFL